MDPFTRPAASRENNVPLKGCPNEYEYAFTSHVAFVHVNKLVCPAALN